MIRIAENADFNWIIRIAGRNVRFKTLHSRLVCKSKISHRRWETNLSIARLVKSKLNSVFKRFLPILTSVMNYCKISQNIVLFWVQIG